MSEPAAPQRSLAKIFTSSSSSEQSGFVFNFIDAGRIIDELSGGGEPGGNKKKKKRSKKKKGKGQDEAKVYNADSSSSEDEAPVPQSPPLQPQQLLSLKPVVSTPLPSAKDAAAPAPASTTTTSSSKQVPRESPTKAKKAKAKSKGKHCSPLLTDDDDESWFDPQPQAPPMPRPTGEAPSGPVQRGLKEKAPFFRTAKLDPTLDAASAQRLRFGDGLNIVAIGPPKIKNANWIEDGGAARLHSSPFSFGFNM